MFCTNANNLMPQSQEGGRAVRCSERAPKKIGGASDIACIRRYVLWSADYEADCCIKPHFSFTIFLQFESQMCTHGKQQQKKD